MATTRQIAANRRNARKSTGPRTGAGKSVSRLNGVRHGLTANTTVLEGEDAKAFSRLQRELIDRLTPKGPVEGELVDRLVALLWRLRRAPAAEAALLAALDEETAGARPSQAATDLHDRHGILVARLQRYEMHLERSFMRTLALLGKLREGQKPALPRPPEMEPGWARAELARRIQLMSERGRATAHIRGRDED